MNQWFSSYFQDDFWVEKYWPTLAGVVIPPTPQSYGYPIARDGGLIGKSLYSRSKMRTLPDYTLEDEELMLIISAFLHLES